MTHGSLFSGIGGFDLAAEWAGWTNVFHCEINPFGQKVLKYYWPNAISYDDITKTDFTIHRGQIDVLTGGFPCQPFSVAGKRNGTADHRNLWPEYFRAIREIQPLWVVGENVPGIINWSDGLVFEQVQADLESEGYEVWPVILPACGVNAPHKRERVWFVAYANNGRSKEQKLQHSNLFTGSIRHNQQTTPNTDLSGCERQNKQEPIGWSCNTPEPAPYGKNGATSNTNSRRQSSEKYGQKESVRFAENGLSGNWQNFPTQSPVYSRNDGIPSGLDGITFSKHRNESIKAYGNAIVPQVAYQIFKAINQFNNQ